MMFEVLFHSCAAYTACIARVARVKLFFIIVFYRLSWQTGLTAS